MVDRYARKKLAEELRHLTAGLTTNDAFQSSVCSIKTQDIGYWAVVDQAWFLYSDLSTHRLKGSHALSKDDRRMVGRFVLFLQSGLEYEWPRHPCRGFTRLLAGILSFGKLPKYFDRKWKSTGDFEVYPFIRRSDFENANQNPKLLAG
jgi:hypothetical protein